MTFFRSLLDYTITLTPQILDGLLMTLSIFGVTLILSIPLGLIVAIGRNSKFNSVKKIVKFYILIMRGTPLLLQIVFIYFGLPSIGVVIERYPTAIIAFTLNYTAYFGEIFRAGIEAIGKEQYEAAEVLGLSKRETFFRIIFPQAFKVVLPSIANEVITLIKDTALVYVIGLNEILRVGKVASNRDATLLPLVITAIVYLILNWIVSEVLTRIEKKYKYYR